MPKSQIDITNQENLNDYEIQLNPEKFNEILNCFNTYINGLIGSYFLLFYSDPEEKTKQNKGFEEYITEALSESMFFDYSILKHHLIKIISEVENDNVHEKNYNLLKLSIKNLKEKLVKKEPNFTFDFAEIFSENYASQLDFFFTEFKISNEKNHNEASIKQTKFETNDFYNYVYDEIENAEKAIDEVFSIFNFLTIEKTDKPIKSKIIEPIRFDGTQTQIVYLFQKLIDEKFINLSLNPNIWKLVSTYFSDKDNKPLKAIHQTKYNLENTKKGKPKEAQKIEEVVKSIKSK